MHPERPYLGLLHVGPICPIGYWRYCEEAWVQPDQAVEYSTRALEALGAPTDRAASIVQYALLPFLLMGSGKLT